MAYLVWGLRRENLLCLIYWSKQKSLVSLNEWSATCVVFSSQTPSNIEWVYWIQLSTWNQMWNNSWFTRQFLRIKNVGHGDFVNNTLPVAVGQRVDNWRNPHLSGHAGHQRIPPNKTKHQTGFHSKSVFFCFRLEEMGKLPWIFSFSDLYKLILQWQVCKL